MNFAQFYTTLNAQPVIALILVLMLGAVFGSFANVIIWRLPRGKSIVSPGSQCPQCGIPIPLWRNVPVLSFVLQRGRAACCGNQISLRYPIIEMLCALAAGLLYVKDGLGAALVLETVWMLLLIILAAIDLEHYRLPNVLVGFGAGWAVFGMVLFPQQSWSQAGLGLLAAVFFALGMLVIGKAVSGSWSGFGDLKLTLVLGFAFGVGGFLILFISATFGALLYGLYRRRQSADKRIPMGPFFALGVWIALWCGDMVLKWYLGLVRLGG